MGDYDDVDLDRSTMRAWSRFRSDLADRIVAMADDDVLVVDAESGLADDTSGAAPYVQFCAWGEDLVRAEVSSNGYLDEELRLDHDGEAALVRLGWSAPTHAVDDEPDGGSANFHLDAGRREGDRLAAMAVAALREVFGVPHPAFLTWPGGDRVGAPAGEPGGAPSADDRPDEPLAVMPESAEHLRTLVAAALTAPEGPPIEFDEEGDIPLPYGSALLFVRVSDEAAVVEMFSFVVRGVVDTERAAFEVAVLNRDSRTTKFVLLDDAVLATQYLLAAPFVPRHLRALARAMADVVDRVDDDLVARVGGRRAVDVGPADGVEASADEDATGDVRTDDGEAEEDGEAETHPALLTLLHLEPEGAGVDPGLAASVCDHDRDLVLRLLREAGEQEIAWRTAGERAFVADDAEEAQACFDEARSWEVTTDTLRAALRVIVEQQHAESTADRARAQGARRPVAGGRRRAARGEVQQSLVDDAVVRRDATGQDLLFEPGGGADGG